MDKAKIFLTLFCVVSFVDIMCVALRLDYRDFSKPLIIPMLALYFAFSTPIKKSYWVFIIALGFAWMGDVFLQISSRYFTYGLASFLVMQLIYAYIFFKDWNSNTFTVLISLVTLVGYNLFLINYLWDFLFGDRLPVIIYTIAIAIMAFAAINRSGQLRGYSFVVIGVLLFVFSDTVLAVDNFGPGFRYAGLAVMATYIAAQYLIVEGYAIHLRSLVEKNESMAR